jgi:coenzyme F420-reducing hydrogenase beta subunit
MNKKTSKVIDLVVNNDLCIGCGLCAYKCSNNALEMKINDSGFIVPESTGECNCDGDCISVCPFNPSPVKEVRTENEIAKLFFKEGQKKHPQIGKYIGTYTGYAKEYRLTSSSGGIATYVLSILLEKGIISHVISVKDNSEKGNSHYEYVVSSTREELIKQSKTRYYPVSLAEALSEINDLKGNVAVVGVACFIKGIRLAQYSNPKLKIKIPFLVGIICGGVKSSFYTEYLSNKVGVKTCQKPEFRIKDYDSTASDYSFGCYEKGEETLKSIKMKEVGDMWGTGLFKSNACDFCDDVTTELADISVGDAWMEPFSNEGKGTNVIVTRTHLADQILNDGLLKGDIELDKLSLMDFLTSQRGSFNHRHTGLSYRVKKAKEKGVLIPPKRFDNIKTTFDFRLVQYYRMRVREMSLISWKNTNTLLEYNEKMRGNLLNLKIATKFYHYKRNIFSKGLMKKIIRRYF